MSICADDRMGSTNEDQKREKREISEAVIPQMKKYVIFASERMAFIECEGKRTRQRRRENNGIDAFQIS